MAAENQAGVICDKCGAYGFEGIRYKCFICTDYDLCGKCYEKGEHDARHPFVHIRPGQIVPGAGPPPKVARIDDSDRPPRPEGMRAK